MQGPTNRNEHHRLWHWRVASRLFIVGALATLGPAQAQPEALRIVVGFSAGGSADQWARLMADGLSREMRRPVIVVNQPGAGGNLAAEAVSRSKPQDDVLFMTGASQHGAGAALNTGARFDPEKDFTPIAPIAESLNVVVVRASSPYNSLQSLLASASRPGASLTYGSPGIGTSPHLAGELLRYRTGAHLVHVPFRGAANALTDLIGGHVDMMVVTLTVVREQLAAGRLRALAVLAPQRSHALADVPTAREAGVSNVEMRVWGGLVGPPNMPAAKADDLNRLVGILQESPAFAARLEAMGSGPFRLDRVAFSTFIHDELVTWRKIVKDAGITVEPAEAVAPK